MPGRTAILFYCIVMIGAAAAFAQIPIEPGSKAYPEIEKFFREEVDGARKPTLTCTITPIKPRVAFSFRFFTGFLAEVPAKQFSGNQNSLSILMRVRARTGENLQYFGSSMDLPPIPDDPGKTLLELGGGFYTGRGSYQVDFAINDHRNRVCRKSWSISANDSKVPMQLPPNTITALGLEKWKGLNPQAPGGRVTVFLHAIPLYYRRNFTRLGPFDRSTLLSSLTSLLDQSQFSKARVVVFDLLGKRVLYKQDDFDPAGYKRLADKLETVNFGTVDVQSLRLGVTDMQLVRNLLRDESREAAKSDAIVFLGAEGRPAGKVPQAVQEYKLPPMFYMGFTRFQIPMEDAMFRVVKSSKGKTIALFRPADLANGIRSLSQAPHSAAAQ